ncbi:hypothetical protein M5K25_019430 [Dendrobium thyrsiflorum]|uniref:Uncharacterized protein n=1 Tax=Dendrobium thyrsiflorum TaxID=117978 RepID=A0ABD0UF30_DENTH
MRNMGSTMDMTTESFNKFRFRVYHNKLKTGVGGNEDEPDQDPMVPSSRAIVFPGHLSIFQFSKNLAKSRIFEENPAAFRRPLPGAGREEGRAARSGKGRSQGHARARARKRGVGGVIGVGSLVDGRLRHAGGVGVQGRESFDRLGHGDGRSSGRSLAWVGSTASTGGGSGSGGRSLRRWLEVGSRTTRARRLASAGSVRKSDRWNRTVGEVGLVRPEQAEARIEGRRRLVGPEQEVKAAVGIGSPESDRRSMANSHQSKALCMKDFDDDNIPLVRPVALYELRDDFFDPELCALSDLLKKKCSFDLSFVLDRFTEGIMPLI